MLTCWITGASSGIGRALALLLAEHGHTVYISARSAAALDEMASLHSGHLFPLPCDVSDDAAMAALFRNAPAAPVALDLVILCAGICEYIDLPDLDTASIRRVMDVNFHGIVNASRAALPLLQLAAKRNPTRRPELLGVSSMSCHVGFPRAEAYGASKAAMAYFLKSLRCDVQQWLDVTIVYPGFVATPMTGSNDFPMPFIVSADAAAEFVVGRLGQSRRSISFPWQLQYLLRVASLLPGLWYGVIVKKLSRQQPSGGN